MRYFISFIFAFFLLNTQVSASEHSQGELFSSVTSIHAKDKFWLALHIKLQEGWHTYWRNAGDSGVAPEFKLSLPKGFIAGEPQFLAPDIMQTADMVDYGYNDDAWFLIPITAPDFFNDNSLLFSLHSRWLVCNDQCIPEQGDFSIPLATSSNKTEDMPANPNIVKVNELIAKLPESSGELNFSNKQGKIRFSFPVVGSSVKKALFFPITENFIKNDLIENVAINDNEIIFNFTQAQVKLPKNPSGVISLFLENNQRKDYQVNLKLGEVAPAASGGSYEILVAIISALIGGFILNFMPCVFPILSLKSLAIAKKASAHPDIVRGQGIAYTIGVVMSFVALAGILLAIKASGLAIGWGYQMQSPLFVALLAIFLFVVGLNMSGYFELPILLGNVGTKEAAKDNLIGSFVTGALAVLVATPCTAPFMASAIGFALTQSVAVIFTIFIALGLGMALPFLAISIFPRIVTKLPKPGAWMLTFKQFLAFPIYLTVVWLLWVLTREAGADGLAVTIAAMTLIAFALWLAGHHWRLLSLIITAISIYAVVEFAVPSLQETHEKFSIAKLEQLRKENKPVFVDATADWCITCKVNERLVLSSATIKAKFVQNNVVYLVADWTHGDQEITKYLQSFGRAGVPLYVYYPPNQPPVILPQILTEWELLELTR